MPITPEEVIARKPTTLPEEVFEAFDELILSEWDGHQAQFTLSRAVTAISKKMGISQPTVVKRRLCDIERFYADAGWVVRYEQPDRDQSFPSYFLFQKKP